MIRTLSTRSSLPLAAAARFVCWRLASGALPRCLLRASDVVCLIGRVMRLPRGLCSLLVGVTVVVARPWRRRGDRRIFVTAAARWSGVAVWGFAVRRRRDDRNSGIFVAGARLLVGGVWRRFVHRSGAIRTRTV
jgi:hypothetical protein